MANKRRRRLRLRVAAASRQRSRRASRRASESDPRAESAASGESLTPGRVLSLAPSGMSSSAASAAGVVLSGLHGPNVPPRP